MLLAEIDLNNFRSFSKEKISFEHRLTVLVGENNGGKSNIIDAIRLITTPLNSRREIYCEETDIRFGSTEKEFEIRATFHGLSPPQQGRLLSATIDDSLTVARFGMKYDTSVKRSHIRPILWAGRFESAPEPGCHEMIRHVYLPPLRDARRALASGNPTRINALLNHFLEGRDPDEVAKNLSRADSDPILGKIDGAVKVGLEALTQGVRKQNATLGFSISEKLIEVARDLRFKLADHGLAPEDLQYSGHGFANLLYIATIAVELEKVDNADLTVFLVEEPEAHLHPQLQAAVLNFLKERAQKSLTTTKENVNAPAGELQVIVATHSPNLSAWVPSENIVFIRSTIPKSTKETQVVEQEVKEPETEIAPAPEPEIEPTEATKFLRHESRCIPLAKLNLTGPERRKIDRYLDVTKSALLFGGRVLLVEGIAEALLLPIIAKKYVLKDRQNDLRTFLSSVFVPIEGIDFMPYGKILLSSYNDTRIADRLVIITDGDKTIASTGKKSPGEKRKEELDKLADANDASSVLDVFVNTYSLETELITAGNDDVMKEVYLEMHPDSEQKWDDSIMKNGDELAKAIQEIFKNTRKGDFAHLLAEKINKSDSFFVPGYIRLAIEALVK